MFAEGSRLAVSRRAALRSMAITAGATVGSYLLAACQSAPAAPAASPAAQPTGAPAAAPGAKRQGGKVTWAIAVDPTSLAPFGVLAGAAHEGKELLYDSLVQWDGDLKVQPALATEWSTPDDHSYVFKLRQGVTFHSGKEMDAEDVKYSVELQGNPPKPGAPIPQYPRVAAVDTVDKYTVKLTMKGPDPTVLGWFAWSRWSAIIPKDFYESGKNPATTADGTGPYKLVEYVANDRVAMQRFAGHWRSGSPNVDEITPKVMPDESARVAALRSGAIDGTDVSGVRAEQPGDHDDKHKRWERQQNVPSGA